MLDMDSEYFLWRGISQYVQSIEHAIWRLIWAKPRSVFAFLVSFFTSSLLFTCACVWVNHSVVCIAPMIVCIAFIVENNNLQKEKKNHSKDQQCHIHLVGEKAPFIFCFWHQRVIMQCFSVWWCNPDLLILYSCRIRTILFILE